MKRTQISIIKIAVIFASMGWFKEGADAGLTITNWHLSSSTVSFDINGELDGPAPPNNVDVLYFVNTAAADPGFVTPPGFRLPVSHTWAGSKVLDVNAPIFTGNSLFSTGDYFGMTFKFKLSVRELISGSVSAVFQAGTFNSDEVSALNVVWGDGFGQFSGGTTQTTFAVPEPSSASIFRILDLTLAPNMVTLSFTSDIAYDYRIEQSGNLTPPDWIDSGLGVFPGDGPVTQRTFANSPAQRRFYRVMAIPRSSP